MKILVIAGPNGAGKTTFARRYLKREGDRRRFVNGDDIAAKLRPDDPAAVAQKAGRLALCEMEAHVARGEDFATETTLSGRAYAKRIRRWQASGYRVSIIYLRVPSADHSVARVARRVREGGHHIPEPVIRRRFERSWRNFRDLYRKVVDDWRVYDNSGEVPVLLEESEEWNAVREPGTKWRASGPRQRTTDSGRQQMTEQPWRFPEGEPSNDSILAALVLARKDAMRKVAEYEAKEAAKAAAEAGGGNGEAQLTQPVAKGEPVGG